MCLGCALWTTVLGSSGHLKAILGYPQAFRFRAQRFGQEILLDILLAVHMTRSATHMRLLFRLKSLLASTWTPFVRRSDLPEPRRALQQHGRTRLKLRPYQARCICFDCGMLYRCPDVPWSRRASVRCFVWCRCWTIAVAWKFKGLQSRDSQMRISSKAISSLDSNAILSNA